MFFGMGSYLCAHAAKVWGFPGGDRVPHRGVDLAGAGRAHGAPCDPAPGNLLRDDHARPCADGVLLLLQAPFTGGEDGIQAVPRGKFLGFIDLSQMMNLYWVVLLIFTAGFLLIFRIIHSPFGQVLKAIRENEARATSLGYRTDHYKLVAFVLSAGLAGLAGATKAIVFQLASLTDVHWTMSGEVVLMTLLGGLGTIFGPVVGAFIIVGMQNNLAQLGAWVTVVQGVIFVVCVLAFRRGIVGEIEAFLERRRK
jgi:branched-chain amino acid transport system permease protein